MGARALAIDDVVALAEQHRTQQPVRREHVVAFPAARVEVEADIFPRGFGNPPREPTAVGTRDAAGLGRRRRGRRVRRPAV